MVGRQSGGSISQAYASGEVNGNSDVGGLVGWQSGGSSISQFYATGAVDGTTRVGGLGGSVVGSEAGRGGSTPSYASASGKGNSDGVGRGGRQYGGSSISQ